MDFTFVEFPCTVDLCTLQAYIDCDSDNVKLPKYIADTLPRGRRGRRPTATEAETDTEAVTETAGATATTTITNRPSSLRHLALDVIVANWCERPIFAELAHQADRNYIIGQLDVDLPLHLLATHIRDDFFWHKAFHQRWKSYQRPPPPGKPWISIYMERHLRDYIEDTDPADYDQHNVQSLLDTCAANINQLEIRCLQPALEGFPDHIPLDFILGNLPELRTLRLAYAATRMEKNFYLGCNTLSQNDILHLARGLSRCHELMHFCLYNTKLEAYQLAFLSRSLDKGCHHLTTLELPNCAIGDEGLKQFLHSCNRDSFNMLKVLDLTNNQITLEGAFILSRAIRRKSIERLVLRLNPIESSGAGAILAVIQYLPLKQLDIAACLLDDDITKLFLTLIVQNKTLLHINLTNNNLSEEFGKQLLKVFGFNKTIESIDLRNTLVTPAMRTELRHMARSNESRKAKVQPPKQNQVHK